MCRQYAVCTRYFGRLLIGDTALCAFGRRPGLSKNSRVRGGERRPRLPWLTLPGRLTIEALSTA